MSQAGNRLEQCDCGECCHGAVDTADGQAMLGKDTYGLETNSDTVGTYNTALLATPPFLLGTALV